MVYNISKFTGKYKESWSLYVIHDTFNEVTPEFQIGEAITHHFSANQREIPFNCSFQFIPMFKMHDAIKLDQVHL